MKKIIFSIFVFYVVSCSETTESSYSDYKTLKQSSIGDKSWFPEVISSDCTDIKETHNIDNNNTFGRFQYSTDRIPNLFSESKFEKIEWKEFNEYSLNKTNPKRPKWFIDYQEGISFYKQEKVLFAIDTNSRVLYFVR